MNKNELCVVNTTQMQIWTFTTEENADYDLNRAIKQNEEDNQRYRQYAEEQPEVETWQNGIKRTETAKYEVMTLAEFDVQERNMLLGGSLEEIDSDTYSEMLDILPPICWCTIDGVEMFCMCEMYTGSYTSQYAHDLKTGKYYTKMVDVRDKNTWINKLLYADN